MKTRIISIAELEVMQSSCTQNHTSVTPEVGHVLLLKVLSWNHAHPRFCHEIQIFMQYIRNMFYRYVAFVHIYAYRVFFSFFFLVCFKFMLIVCSTCFAIIMQCWFIINMKTSISKRTDGSRNTNLKRHILCPAMGDQKSRFSCFKESGCNDTRKWVSNNIEGVVVGLCQRAIK